MIKNSYRVPKKQWSKWSEAARYMFNLHHAGMLLAQDMFLHPNTKSIPGEEWGTIAWNSAWFAANAVDTDEFPRILK